MTPTKGPWAVGAGRTIATPSGEFYLTYGKDKHGNPLFKDFCELDANARLIAASPDLHEALKRLTEKVARVNAIQHSGGKINAEDWSELYQLTNQSNAALAKAEGKG